MAEASTTSDAMAEASTTTDAMAEASTTTDAMAEASTTTDLPDAMNVQIKRDESSTPTIYYLMKGAQKNDQFTWDVLEETHDEVTVMFTVFEANLKSGRKYYHQSKPIPKDVWQNISVVKKKYKNGNYKVKLNKSPDIKLGQYF
ncbi:hypothetical protein SNE40_000182 [Patella caerulea]|uniref:Uncharacterized protein n=1 Tax=Patella caerulea TaxID=87958 RepID=A0AAN8KBR4_PATCE